jgi:hypothetical protein
VDSALGQVLSLDPASGGLSVLAGGALGPSLDGPGPQAVFLQPRAIAQGPTQGGTTLFYLSDAQAVRVMSCATAAAASVAGTPSPSPGPPSAAPSPQASSSSAGCTVTRVAGFPGSNAVREGVGVGATFSFTGGLAFWGGTLFVSDTAVHTREQCPLRAW